VVVVVDDVVGDVEDVEVDERCEVVEVGYVGTGAGGYKALERG
jgi:hypothetical protein